MTNIERKNEILEASKRTLESYLEGTHESRIDVCTVCIASSKMRLAGLSACKSYMMSVFQQGDCYTCRCLNRKCKPVSMTEGNEYLVSHVNRVIKFWESIISLLEQVPEEKFTEVWFLQDWWFDMVTSCDNKIFEETQNDEQG